MRVAIILAMFALAFACSDDEDDEDDYSGAIGSCTATTVTGFTTCTDYSYEVTAEDDPIGDLQSLYDTACSAEVGTWSTTETCSTTTVDEVSSTVSVAESAVGSCELSATNSGATVTATIFYAGDLVTDSSAESSCTSVSGTYTAATTLE